MLPTVLFSHCVTKPRYLLYRNWLFKERKKKQGWWPYWVKYAAGSEPLQPWTREFHLAWSMKRTINFLRILSCATTGLGMGQMPHIWRRVNFPDKLLTNPKRPKEVIHYSWRNRIAVDEIFVLLGCYAAYVGSYCRRFILLGLLDRCPETSVTATLSCATSQKSGYLVYTAAEDWS